MKQANWTAHADLIVKNAKIYTVALTIDDVKAGKTDFPIYSGGAVAVKDGLIAAVSDRVDGADALIGLDTRVIDAGGRTLIPGLVDSHTHALWTGAGLLKIDHAGNRSVEEMVAAVGEQAAQKAPGEWIEGLKWNHLSWTEKRLPTRWDLDKVSPDHPVYCVRLCWHLAVANSKALELAGIRDDAPDPENGMFERDEHGVVTGVLHEYGAMNLVAGIIPEPSDEQNIQAIEAAAQAFCGHGVTSLIDANLTVEQMRAYSLAKRQGRLPYRAGLTWYFDTSKGGFDHQMNRLNDTVALTGFGDDRLKLNAVKVMVDGIPAVGTAYMRRNYKHMPETNGFTVIEPQDLNRLAVRCQQLGWQLAMHTVGNKAADVGLAAFAEAAKVGDVRPLRHHLIHHPWPCEDQFPLMREMNIGVPVQTSIYHFMGESAILHEDMAHFNTPCKAYFDHGVIAGGSSDSPVGNFNPFLGMFIAVTREDSEGVVWGADQRITPIQALIMYTKNSAFFTHDDHQKGSIEVGNLGDLVLVDRDFLTGPPADIRNTQALLTVVGGEVVHAAEPF